MENVKVIEEPPKAQTLELVVTNKSVGFLETNISALEEYVEVKLKEYEPENYMPTLPKRIGQNSTKPKTKLHEQGKT